MNYSHDHSSLHKSHAEMLMKSLERLSLYDGNGKVKLLKISPKTDLLNVIGDLDLAEIQDRM